MKFFQTTCEAAGWNIVPFSGSLIKPVKCKISLPSAAGVCLPQHTVFRRCFWVKPKVSKAFARLRLQRCRALKPIITEKQNVSLSPLHSAIQFGVNETTFFKVNLFFSVTLLDEHTSWWSQLCSNFNGSCVNLGEKLVAIILSVLQNYFPW